MFGSRRWAREEYAVMGMSPIWTVENAVELLTSFEIEVSGAYGTSDDLISFQECLQPKSESGVVSLYEEPSIKWSTLLNKALWDGEIPYANIPRQDESPLPPLPEGAGRTITDTGSFLQTELRRFLAFSVESGSLDLDLKTLYEFLNGNGTAPSRAEASAPKSGDKRSVSCKPANKDKKKSERGKAGAAKRWSEVQGTKEVIKKYVAEINEQGCTCNHSQLGVEIHENAIDSSGKALLGRSEISLDVVKETVKDFFKDRDIKRVKGVDVFKDESACKIHHPEEFKYQQEKKAQGK